MAEVHQSCVGYGAEPFASLVADYPGEDVYPQGDFRTEWGPVFHAALPVDGESGTLKRRSKGTPARGNLHAKTGTTNTVAALGGYVTAKNGEVLAFSLIYNGSDRWNAKAAMDQIGATMAEFVRE